MLDMPFPSNGPGAGIWTCLVAQVGFFEEIWRLRQYIRHHNILDAAALMVFVLFGSSMGRWSYEHVHLRQRRQDLPKMVSPISSSSLLVAYYKIIYLLKLRLYNLPDASIYATSLGSFGWLPQQLPYSIPFSQEDLTSTGLKGPFYLSSSPPLI